MKERKTIATTSHELYATWSSMKARCYDENRPNYKHYGGRGISVCESWRYNFFRFVEDMGERPHGATLDRVDNCGDYSKDNCVWSTLLEQNSNKRNNKLIEYNGRVKTLSQWGRETGVGKTTIQRRLLSGWCVEHALYKAVRKYDKKGAT